MKTKTISLILVLTVPFLTTAVFAGTPESHQTTVQRICSSLQLLEVTTSKTEYWVGEEVMILIANQGNVTVTLSCVPPLLIFNETGSKVYPCLHLMIIVPIQPGQTMNYTWNQRSCFDDKQVPPGNYSVLVLVAQIGELPVPSGDVRFAIRSIAEDVNNDGEVDMRDVAVAARAFGTKPGDPNWNALPDLNRDNAINMMDIGMIAKKFGWGFLYWQHKCMSFN
jgi:hypothetical protein